MRHPFPVGAHFSLASKFFAPKAAPTESSAAIPDGSSPVHLDPFLLPPAQAYLAWPLGIPVSLHFHLSTSDQAFARDSEDADLPQFVWHDITFGDWNEARTVDYNVHLPEVHVPRSLVLPMTLNAFDQSVQHNGSLWAHMYLTKDNADPDPSGATYKEDSVHHVKKRAC